jgi:hypothetical protein
MATVMNAIVFEDILASIPPAAITFAEMADLRRKANSGLLVEGVDYDTVNTVGAEACFKPGSLS